jgi:hypothetical protein
LVAGSAVFQLRFPLDIVGFLPRLGHIYFVPGSCLFLFNSIVLGEVPQTAVFSPTGVLETGVSENYSPLGRN